MNHSSLIDRLGGTTAVADLFGVRPQAVSQWRNKGIPGAKLIYLQKRYPDIAVMEKRTMSKSKKRHPDSDLIDRAGGTSAVAKLLGIKPPSVTAWREKGIPQARRMYLELAMPEIFNWGIHASEHSEREGERT